MIFIFTMMNPLFNLFTLRFKACHLCKQTRNILRKNFKHIVKLSSLINRVNSSKSLTVFFFQCIVPSVGCGSSRCYRVLSVGTAQ